MALQREMRICRALRHFSEKRLSIGPTRPRPSSPESPREPEEPSWLSYAEPLALILILSHAPKKKCCL